jgi:hypothetical protein
MPTSYRRRPSTAPRASARRGPDRHAEQRHEQDQSDQATPQCSTRGSQRAERGLVKLDLAVAFALDDHNVIELDLVALDGLAQIRRHLLGRWELGRSLSASDAKAKLVTALQQLEASYQKSFARLSCD